MLEGEIVISGQSRRLSAGHLSSDHGEETKTGRRISWFLCAAQLVVRPDRWERVRRPCRRCLPLLLGRELAPMEMLDLRPVAPQNMSPTISMTNTGMA